MIELSIQDLFFLVAAGFLLVIGTLLTLVLLRALRILKVIEDVAGYYWMIKQYLGYYSSVPASMKQKVTQYFSSNDSDEREYEEAFSDTK